ncbi:hypothetical protein EDC01DRAFT_240002 [Geopyxis carbonaria]|nr:hypothetical protein EDC01DRAFT_240002 [Geopyxis carbonaria]
MRLPLILLKRVRHTFIPRLLLSFPAKLSRQPFSSKNTVRKIKPTAVPMEFPCTTCKKTYKSASALQEHSRVKHAHVCLTCNGRTFTSAEDLQKHLETSSKHVKSTKSPPKSQPKESKSPPKRQPKESNSRDETDAIDKFFAKYPNFDYDPDAPYREQFHKLCYRMGWKRGDEEREEAWAEFRIAMVLSFGTDFGKKMNDPVAWQRLCQAAGIKNIPDDIKGKQEALLSIDVNLVDLHECRRAKPQTFPTHFPTRDGTQLDKYTIRTGRFFPLEEAYQDELLAFLLREITGTYHGHRRLDKNGKYLGFKHHQRTKEQRGGRGRAEYGPPRGDRGPPRGGRGMRGTGGSIDWGRGARGPGGSMDWNSNIYPGW